MADETYAKDRFDDVPRDRGKVGAHRAEQPRMRGLVVFLWAALAAIVLFVAGLLIVLAIMGRGPFAGSAIDSNPTSSIEPRLDTSYSVLVLNATPDESRTETVRSELIAAGWDESSIVVSDASERDFKETTIYYALVGDAPVAEAVRDLVDGAVIVMDNTYQPADSEDAKQITIVIGLDAQTE